jgi:translocation and assembly module TamB
LTNPSLKFVATAGNANLTSTLTISGYVRDPKIALTSVPDMPQDEILSQLLFNTAKTRLNPFQIAQIAAALASISGIGPSGGDPLGGVRSALGLDQLSVGSNASGGAALQAGRYIAPGVRIGASQSATGTGSQATVQIDLAKGLKLETTVGTGSASATPGVGGSSNGTGLGLTYQFEY